MRDFLLFLLALVASLLFMRWRARVAARKLQTQTLPEAARDLPQHPQGILLLFHHPQCGPCKPMVRQFEALSASAPGRVQTINVAEQPHLARAFGIRVTPTTLFIQDNAVQAAFIGAVSVKKLRTLLALTP
ncbi:MAG TPA: thioredoxin [Gammaproteobacteria bacterium]|nr:thioredoxin [Gammaproteobacteria bacterium]